MMRFILAVSIACAAAAAPAPSRKSAQPQFPIHGLDTYLVGVHPLKDEPSHQMLAHHFCKFVNEDLLQCALFDGNGKDANLNGIEYIISEKLYDGLSKEEQPYWHPHNYEILSGQLVAPSLGESDEKALMKKAMNSYGKTWHVWMTGSAGHRGDVLPLGPPRLAWSLNHDGESRPGLLERRDKELKIDGAKKRADRQELLSLAHPQRGVNALKFANIKPIMGVLDKDAAP